MTELDYQMALVLQHKFEQEHRRKENTDRDHLLALELEEQFKAEQEIERPKNNLAYQMPSRSATNNTSSSLVDPSWEVIDPTPDIYVLFSTFNQKFFWNKLGSVTVSWSPRMTLCAGVCCYQGRGGLCSIKLSEPLLKLRPRKDLVETLLHEMIHAYLFITEQNRDRDGHGPEFHKHMYRINSEAGTNITVYHDFHDEVRLYQQHWWRCDGPCQNRKPFFGVVRRAINRAPGPTDPWWGMHTQNCGGTFIKIKSPETKSKTKSKVTTEKNVSNKDIRDFIKVSTKSKSASEIKPFTGSGKILSDRLDSDNQDYSKVREHWLKKYGEPSQFGAKRPSISSTAPVASKVIKLDVDVNQVQCPVCQKMFEMKELNAHLDNCLKEDVCKSEKAPDKDAGVLDSSFKTCCSCQERLSPEKYNKHVHDCLLKMCDDFDKKYDSGKISCLACGKLIFKYDLESHLDECSRISNIFKIPDEDVKYVGTEESYNCPFCLRLFLNSKMQEHLNNCFQSSDDGKEIVKELLKNDI